MVEDYVTIFLAVGLFVAGLLIGIGTEKRIVKAFVIALNINRELGEGTEGDPKLFIDKGKIKGSRTVSFSVEFKGNVIDFVNKKKYTEKGTIDLTDADIAELRKLPQFRKTPI